MKTAMLLLTAMFFAQSATAQEHLIDLGYDNGGFGGSAVRITSVTGENVVVSGSRGSWIFGHFFQLGVAWYTMTSEVNAPRVARDEFNEPNMEMEFSYGGIEAGYIHNWERLIHWNATLLAGPGGANFTNVIGGGDVDDTDALFVLEPSVRGELNVFSWLRFNVDIHYRYVMGANLSGIDNGDLSGLGAGVTLKFGSF